MPAEQKQNPPLSTPFNNIALSLSGGGFRAAAYSLGIMSYLDWLKLPNQETLLDKVTFISSTSGGTITNAFYSMYKYQGKSFKDCYIHLLEKMQGEELLNAVLEKLNNDNEWDPPGTGKRRNLINAFAKIYDEKLFAGETFKIFWDKQQQNNLSVCFNATDFYRGLSFRFQTDGNNKTFEHVGNRYIHFDKNNGVYKNIKLADILAASSCFPAGFEPIIFPDDFTHTALTQDDLKNTVIIEAYDSAKKTLQEPLAFMDGGITDNQGLQSTMYADQRNRKKNNPFDLIIVGDVTSHFMDNFKPPAEQKAEGWRNLTINRLLSQLSGIGKSINRWLTTSIIVFIISIAAIIADNLYLNIPAITYAGCVLAGISLTTSILLWRICRFRDKQPFLKRIFGAPATPEIKTILESLNISNNFSEDIITKLMAYLGNTRLNVLEQMVKARAASVLTMTMDVNLKHTRRLIYQIFFTDDAWTDRRLYNVIFELGEFNKANRTLRIEKLDWATDDDKKLLNSCTGKLCEIADEARTMGTTLWFGKADVEKEKLKNLVACGQFTTCMNLIEYILSIERKIDKKEIELNKAEIDKLTYVKKQVLEDWEKFRSDPYFLYNSYRQ